MQAGNERPQEGIETAIHWLHKANARSLNRMSDVALAKGEMVCAIECLLQVVENQQAQIEELQGKTTTPAAQPAEGEI